MLQPDFHFSKQKQFKKYYLVLSNLAAFSRNLRYIPQSEREREREKENNNPTIN